MTDFSGLERSFEPLGRRVPPGTVFFRVIGRDNGGVLLSMLERYRGLAQKNGLAVDGFANPSGDETREFLGKMGGAFGLARPQLERQTGLWLGQVPLALRPALTGAVQEALGCLRRQGGNDNILKNAYTKFMCWLHGPAGRVLARVGGVEPPKVLFEGDISKHEVLFLRILQQVGCDVWYLNFLSPASYDKADPSGQLSQLFAGDLLGAPPPPPPPPPPWDGAGKNLLVNEWVGDRPVWEAMLLNNAQRADGDPSPRTRTVFSVMLGADERSEYRNRLFHLKQKLEQSGRTWTLAEKKIAPPMPEEAASFRGATRKLSRPELIRVLAEAMPAGKPWTHLVQRALSLVMGQFVAGNENLFYNYSVRLACWLRRYAEALFRGGPGQREAFPPALIYYGPISEPEAALLWALAQTGMDVLYVCSDKTGCPFPSLFLPHVWIDADLGPSLPHEPFPRREEKLRARTTAYDAARELDHLLYSDTGMFRDRQFTRSQPVTLKTTLDEVAQLWPEEAQYRPSFRTEAGAVYVPNLFSKICGVEGGDLPQYWERIRAMITPSTYLVTGVPFFKPDPEGMSPGAARAFLHGGRLDPAGLKAAPRYRYGYLPEDTQNYILEKIQALMDYDLIVNGGPDLPAVTLSVLMNLDKELLRLVQGFDFTRAIPKLLIVDVTETVFSLEDCVLTAFLNLVGFDIAVFTPTGYRNLETHIRPDSFDTLTAGAFCYDLSVPELRVPPRGSAGGKKPGWKRFLFGD